MQVGLIQPLLVWVLQPLLVGLIQPGQTKVRVLVAAKIHACCGLMHPSGLIQPEDLHRRTLHQVRKLLGLIQPKGRLSFQALHHRVGLIQPEGSMPLWAADFLFLFLSSLDPTATNAIAGLMQPFGLAVLAIHAIPAILTIAGLMQPLCLLQSCSMYQGPFLETN